MKSDKLLESTQKALQNKLTEDKKVEKEIISEIDSVINTFNDDDANYDYRYKYYDSKIKDNNLTIHYQTQEDIDIKDVEYICANIVPDIKEILKDYENNINNITITFYDTTLRYIDGKLKKSFKITPVKIKKSDTFNNSKLSVELINSIIDMIYDIDYDWAADTVGGATGNSIYEDIEDFFNKDSYYINDIKAYCQEHNLNIDNIDFSNRNIVKPLALLLIKTVCEEEDWSVAQAKKDCCY